MKYLLIIPILITTISINAEVITDGTLGQQINLPGSNFQITSDLGQQHGGNLFHSFQDFNLNSLETATFSGLNSVHNIISRVTGGNPSNIDGLIRSTIPNADFYFLNPYGIMFGSNAKLDVQGSFHVSTADYLRLGENGRFDVSNPNNSLLTVAPVESFGFLNKQAASISIQRLGEITEFIADNAKPLSVPEGKTISFVGGDITINKGTFYKKNEKNIIRIPSIFAPTGRINIVAVATNGEVKLQKDNIDISSFTKLANIFIKDYSVIDTDGSGGGKIFIRGKQLTQENSKIQANTNGNKNNSLIDIQVEKHAAFNNSYITSSTNNKGTDNLIKIRATVSAEFYDNSFISAATRGNGNAGTVLIKAPIISFGKNSHIYNSTLSTGNAGNIILRASEKLILKDGATIEAPPYSSSTSANGGLILVEAKDIFITKGAYISSTTFSDGKGGETIIRATGKITLSDTDQKGLAGGIFSASNPGINMDDTKAGNNNGGYISVEANELLIEKGAIISSNTISRPREDGSHRKSANGGNIDIKVHGTLNIDGINLHGQTYDGLGSGIYVRSRGENTGDKAGHINIEAGKINLTNGGVIASTTENHAHGGNISIQAKKIMISGDSSKLKLREPAKHQITYKEDFPDSN